ncbi:MAG: GAF domain-containing protein [Acidobacteriota bacterium]
MADNNNQTETNSVNEEDYAERVSQKVAAIDVTNSLSAPLKKAIDEILQVAAESVGSADASVLIRDGNEGGLRFLLAVSELEDALLKIRIPPGKGIAGLVFSSGQPMAVNDCSSEGSFWSHADEKTGFKTVTLLATPLRTGNETIGVLEFVNRPGEPPYPPFTPEEMDRAAQFADTIAHLLNAYELAVLVESLFDRSIKTSVASEESGQVDNDGVREWLQSTAAAPEHRDLLLLVVSLREIVGRGQTEREMCRDVLEALARFTAKNSASSSSYFNF